MDENIQKILGADYKDGMTPEEVLTALSLKKIADLSSGEYVAKGKLLEQQTKLQEREAQIRKFEELEKSRMTEEQLKVEAEKLREAEITKLKAEVSRVKTEKVLVGSGLAESDYSDLLNKLVEVNADKSHEVAESLASVIKKVKENTAKEINAQLLGKQKNPANGNGSGGDLSQFRAYQAELDKKDFSGKVEFK